MVFSYYSGEEWRSGHKELCIKSSARGEGKKRAPDVKHTKACSGVRTQEFEKSLKHIVEMKKLEFPN